MAEPGRKSLENDAVTNSIYRGIKKGIEVAMAEKCYGSAIILIYSAMDTMACLDMPEGRTEVERADFVTWAERYIHFPCKEQLTGLDLYGARCATLHTYGAESKLSREGKCRVIAYGDKGVPEVVPHRSSPQYVLVSVAALKDALFAGIDRFLIDVFKDSSKAKLVESRLVHLLQRFPLKNNVQDKKP